MFFFKTERALLFQTKQWSVRCLGASSGPHTHPSRGTNGLGNLASATMSPLAQPLPVPPHPFWRQTSPGNMMGRSGGERQSMGRQAAVRGMKVTALHLQRILTVSRSFLCTGWQFFCSFHCTSYFSFLMYHYHRHLSTASWYASCSCHLPLSLSSWISLVIFSLDSMLQLRFLTNISQLIIFNWE